MLKKGAPNLTEVQLAAVDQAFADRSTERTVEAGRIKHLGELQQAKDYDGLLKEVDSLSTQYPAWATDNKTSLDGFTLRALLHVNPNKAYDLAVKAKGSPEELSFSLIFTAEPGQETRFYDYAVEALTANCEHSKKENRKSPYLSALAKACYLDGNPSKAVEHQQEYIASMKEMLASRPEVKQAMRDKILGDLEKQLKEYQDAAAKK
jgi:hypothetical protein